MLEEAADAALMTEPVGETDEVLLPVDDDDDNGDARGMGDSALLPNPLEVVDMSMTA